MFKKITLIIALLGLTGCAGLGNMKSTEFTSSVKADKTIVNIVRRSYFMGDGANVEAWDGKKFIGTIGAGKLLQYETTPGEHTFMTYVQGSWAVAKGHLKAGKTYYLKFNMTGWGPTILGVAKANDKRISEWNKMPTVTLDTSAPKEVPEKYILKAQEILKRVDEGTANVTAITDEHAL